MAAAVLEHQGGEILDGHVDAHEIHPAQIVHIAVQDQLVLDAPGVEQASQAVPALRAGLPLRRLLRRTVLADPAHQADDLSEFIIDGHAATGEVPVSALHDVMGHVLPEGDALLQEPLFPVDRMLRQKMPADLLVGTALELVGGGKPEVLQKARAGPQIAPLRILPEDPGKLRLGQALPQIAVGDGDLLLAGHQVGEALLHGLNVRVGIPDDGKHRPGTNVHQDILLPGVLALPVPGAEEIVDVAAAGPAQPLLHGIQIKKLSEHRPVLGEDRALLIAAEHAAGALLRLILIVRGDVQGREAVGGQVEKSYPLEDGIDVAQLRVQGVEPGEIQTAGVVVQTQQDAVGLFRLGDAFGLQFVVVAVGNKVYLRKPVEPGLLQDIPDPFRNPLLGDTLPRFQVRKHGHAPLGFADGLLKGGVVIVGPEEPAPPKGGCC